MDNSAILDELMGADRNMSTRERASRERAGVTPWRDPSRSLCRAFLCGFCPKHAFESTRMNLGVCGREHSASVQVDFQARASRREKLMYSSELLRELEDLERDLQVKVRANKERIEEAERVAMQKEEVQVWQRKIEEKKRMYKSGQMSEPKPCQMSPN